MSDYETISEIDSLNSYREEFQTGVKAGEECETCGSAMGELHCPRCLTPADGTEDEPYTRGWNASNQHKTIADCPYRLVTFADEWLQGFAALDTSVGFDAPDGDSPQY